MTSKQALVIPPGTTTFHWGFVPHIIYSSMVLVAAASLAVGLLAYEVRAKGRGLQDRDAQIVALKTERDSLKRERDMWQQARSVGIAVERLRKTVHIKGDMLITFAGEEVPR